MKITHTARRLAHGVRSLVSRESRNQKGKDPLAELPPKYRAMADGIGRERLLGVETVKGFVAMRFSAGEWNREFGIPGHALTFIKEVNNSNHYVTFNPSRKSYTVWLEP